MRGRKLFAGPLAVLLVSLFVDWLGGPRSVSLPLAVFAFGWMAAHLCGLNGKVYRRLVMAAPANSWRDDRAAGAPVVLTPVEDRTGIVVETAAESGHDVGATVPGCRFGCADGIPHGCVSCGEPIEDPAYCWLGECLSCWETGPGVVSYDGS